MVEGTPKGSDEPAPVDEDVLSDAQEQNLAVQTASPEETLSAARAAASSLVSVRPPTWCATNTTALSTRFQSCVNHNFSVALLRVSSKVP